MEDYFQNSIHISYRGDLILLKDQVISAKINIKGKYEFDEKVKYTLQHFHESHYTIGVYEGPSVEINTSYSTSNFGDLLLVKKAGIDLVTNANNHLLDKKIKGAMKTLDVLDKCKITNIGTYINKEEKRKNNYY